MSNTIEITGIDLREFAKKVYELSVPQGMGFMHFTDEPLSNEEANNLIIEDYTYALDMDYVKGRACKMMVCKKEDKLLIGNSWYDHTDSQLQELLNHFNITIPKLREHSVCCNCVECRSKGR